ncbi:MAG: bis-aminopropyl spermidine synthase family protein [Sandaracinaceae bacterium]
MSPARDAAAVRSAVRRAMAARTPDKPAIGAYHVDRPSMLERVRTLLALAPKGRVLFVGDDDLTSVALHHLGVRNITVVDLDPEVLAAIDTETRGRVRTVEFDLRGTYEGRWPRVGRGFALFSTDPPYTRDALRVFTAVGLRALDEGGAGYVVYPAEAPRGSSVREPDELARALQGFITANGSILVDVRARSQRSFHGTVSSALVLRRIDKRKVLLDDLSDPAEFYLPRRGRKRRR